MSKELPRLRHVSSKHVEGISDLVVVAPVKEGFIDAFEHVSYETRLKMTMDALFRMRTNSREFYLDKPFLDTVEKIQSLRSYRLAVIDVATEIEVVKKLVLAVTFDRPFEPYIRDIWWPLGPMLDVLFCNCDFYVPAYENSYEDYLRWLRRYQVDSGFFYATTNLSVVDFQYLVQIEKLHREGGDDVELKAIATIAENPSTAAKTVRGEKPEKTDDIAFDALGGLFRLASFYPVDRPAREGRFLWRAAHSLLEGWTAPESKTAPKRFQERLKWYETEAYGEPARSASVGQADKDSAAKPAVAAASEPTADADRKPVCDETNVQGGILTGYDKRNPDRPITHGAMLLLQVTDAKAAREFLGSLIPRVSTEAPKTVPEDGVYLNIAFTHRGLRSLQVPALELRRFPQEFLEGSEERAGLIGDVMENHPRRWKLPKRNWPPRKPGATAAPRPPVELAEIDMVVQLRIACSKKADTFDLFDAHGTIDRDHPLAAEVETLAELATRQGVQLLSVEPMKSVPRPNEPYDGVPDDPASSYITREHFGFVDGFSQPVVDDGRKGRDIVPRGELLLGYPNHRGDDSPKSNPWLDDGSFLVVRKMRQDVKALDDWLVAECKASRGLEGKELVAKLMGRTRDGDLLYERSKPGENLNDFDFEDEAASACPFQSHIRRANPRTPRPTDPDEAKRFRPVPRIMRRGMSYGPTYEPYVEGSDKAERGLVFMCYQSSIAEQYEVIQRWLNGGNSSGIGAAQNDPLTGVGRPGDARVFRWSKDGEALRHRLDGEGGRNPFVSLEWLIYLFTPSIATLRTIAAGPAATHQAELDLGRRHILDLGRAIVDRLQVAEILLNAQDELRPLLFARYYGLNYLPRRDLPSWKRVFNFEALQGSNQGRDLTLEEKVDRLALMLACAIIVLLRLARKRLFPRDAAFQRLRARWIGDPPTERPRRFGARLWWRLGRLLCREPDDFDHLDKVAWIWKAFLEDFGAKDPAERGWGMGVWAAIRTDHGGVLRVPYGDLVVTEKDPPPEEKTDDDLDLGKPREKWTSDKPTKTGKPIEKVVLVARRDLVDEVYRKWWLYSVEGEAPRMKRSFGHIYIGRDPGPDYDREATETNRILMAVGEEKAFEVAQRLAKAAIDQAFVQAAALPVRFGKPTTKLDLSNDFITPVLGDICTHWFGIPDPDDAHPDGKHVEKGTWRREPYREDALPRCPGDFMAPSRYFFYPDPNPAVQDFGRQLGERLFKSVKKLVAATRESGLPKGEIAVPMFKAIRDDELLARNLIGVMMGLLPPADGCLRGALHEWLKEQKMWRIQRALLARREAGISEPYIRAQEALEGPLRQAMQKRPAPDMVWRTATRGHWLGKEPGKRVYVRAGERVFVGIVSATLEAQGEGSDDVYPIFGGDRTVYDSAGRAPPPHACPAYAMGMGTMMGMLTALLESGAIEAQPAPLTIQITRL